MYKTIKTMRQALAEARAYRDPVNEDKGFSTQQIKMAYGVLNDPRYKQGNYSGAVSAIEKIAKGLSDHPDVANALRRANEELEETFTKKDFKDNERDNEHGLNAKKVVDMFGTGAEKMKIDAINARHNMRGSISREDQRTRDDIVNKYYSRLK